MRIGAPLRAAAAAALLIAVGACGSTSQSRSPSTTSSAQTATLPGTGHPPVTIGDKNFTEQFVLGELYYEALKAQGFSVQLNRNIGPTEVTLKALQSGQLGMYPEYIDTWNESVAGDQRSFRSLRTAYQAGQDYVRRDEVEGNKPGAHRFGDGRAEKEGGNEVEKGRPDHRLEGRKHAGGNDGGDGVGGIVKTVDEIEHQRDRDDEDGELVNGHRG